MAADMNSGGRPLPRPATATDFYLKAILDQLQVIAARLPAAPEPPAPGEVELREPETPVAADLRLMHALAPSLVGLDDPDAAALVEGVPPPARPEPEPEPASKPRAARKSARKKAG